MQERVRLPHQVENRRAQIADMQGVTEALKDQITSVVDGVHGNVLGEGLGALVELEGSEDVEGESLALEGEETMVPSPAQEL
ncbi:unnamed protein product [Prunus armeniaca]|uniref:Uncharacterized protein n=1 Tax=Prunus armeniaca TaxID=36596 RepID=A0A6J5YAZ9_PRUAR|nr:unnamed protein product [Prunus armeniaca]